MSDLDKLDEKIKKELLLKEYMGLDRVVHAEDMRREIEEMRKHEPPFRAMTKIPTLDACLEGFRKGQLITLSGPPKNGKTAFCQTLTKNFTADKKKCLWFSYELSQEELFDKFPMENLDFYVPRYLDSGNVEWIENKIIEAKQKYQTDIVFIDHLDFLRDPNVLKGIGMNLSSYIGGIVQKIKRIAIEQNVVIFLMSHIRKNKWTTNEVPDSEELRDTGQTAQLSDIVLMIIRKRADRGASEIYLENKALLGIVENRHNGKTKKIPLILIGKEYKEETDNYEMEKAASEAFV